MNDQNELPHDEAAEAAVLGSAMLDPRAADEVVGMLEATDFHVPRYEVIFGVIAHMHSIGMLIDAITVNDALTAAGDLMRAGGAGVTHDLAAAVTTTTSAHYHAGIVSRLARRRRIIRAGVQLQQIGFTVEDGSLVEVAQRIVDEATAERDASDVRFVGDIFPDLMAQMDADDDDRLFIPTPWRRLNLAIGGLRPGCLYVVGARPGVGKSVVAAQLAGVLAARGNVAFSSLEMSSHELVARIVSDQLSIMVGKLKDRRLTDRDRAVIAAGAPGVMGTRIAIDDRAVVGPSEVRAFARAVQARPGGLTGVVVDYIQLMRSQGSTSRQEQVSEFSRSMKILAKELNVPVIMLSQLNRGVEDRADGMPRLADLRESGSIEQDADVVMLLRREHDGGSPGPNGMSPELLVLGVEKNRHGETGDVELIWQGEFSRAIDPQPYLGEDDR